MEENGTRIVKIGSNLPTLYEMATIGKKVSTSNLFLGQADQKIKSKAG